MQTSTRLLTAFGAAIVQGLDLEAATTTQQTVESLPFLNADPNSITMSGQSSGAHFSCHMMIVMSGTIKGAGCSHGGAFMVGYGDFRNESALSGDQMAANAISEINELEADGLIDPTCNL